MAEREQEGAASEHKRAQREYEEASGEQEGATREHVNETGVSRGAERQGPSQQDGKIYIFYIHPELRIANCRSGTGKGAGPL